MRTLAFLITLLGFASGGVGASVHEAVCAGSAPDDLTCETTFEARYTALRIHTWWGSQTKPEGYTGSLILEISTPTFTFVDVSVCPGCPPRPITIGYPGIEPGQQVSVRVKAPGIGDYRVEVTTYDPDEPDAFSSTTPFNSQLEPTLALGARAVQLLGRYAA